MSASVILPPRAVDTGDVVRLRRRPPRHWELDFTLYQRGRNLSERSIHTYIWALRRITEATGKPIWLLQPDDLLAFMESSPYNPRTTSQIVAATKQGHKWAAVRGYCLMNGVLAVSPPKVPKQKPKAPVSHMTARRLLEAARTPPGGEGNLPSLLCGDARE